MTWEYSDILKKLFKNAFYNRKTSHIGEIKNPDGVGTYGSIQCGDATTLYFRVKKNFLRIYGSAKILIILLKNIR